MFFSRHEAGKFPQWVVQLQSPNCLSPLLYTSSKICRHELVGQTRAQQRFTLIGQQGGTTYRVKSKAFPSLFIWPGEGQCIRL